uniref:Uncharacterized protein n=1 Tax=Zea mays TaxID=4577 RepID=C4IZ43_MAIZE|nr:unknown [Zea mays]|eukprot:XP_008655944.1 uncharacterized protein LOC103635208 [Zea mays]
MQLTTVPNLFPTAKPRTKSSHREESGTGFRPSSCYTSICHHYSVNEGDAYLSQLYYGDLL